MKNIYVVFALILCTLLLTACTEPSEPVITIEATVAPLTDVQYAQVGATDDLPDPQQKHFSMFTFHFEMEHEDNIDSRAIEMYSFENLKATFQSIDDFDRYWTGSWSSQDNANENFATYDQHFVFYTKDLTKEAIQQALSNEMITVSWVDENEEKVTKEYTLAELVEFK